MSWHDVTAADWIGTTGICLAAHARSSLAPCVESDTLQVEHVNDLMYDIVHGIAPGYLMELCRPCGDMRLRSGSRGDYVVPFSRLSMTRKSFRFSGPKAWNSLPNYVRDAPSRTVFANRLKHISLNLHILEMYMLILLFFVSASEPRRRAPSKCRLIDWID